MTKTSDGAPEGFWDRYPCTRDTFESLCEKHNVTATFHKRGEEPTSDGAQAIKNAHMHVSIAAAELEKAAECWKGEEPNRWPYITEEHAKKLAGWMKRSHEKNDGLEPWEHVYHGLCNFAAEMNTPKPQVPRPEVPRPGAKVEHYPSQNGFVIRDENEGDGAKYLHPDGLWHGYEHPCFYLSRESAQAALDAWRKEEVERAGNS